MMDVQSIKQFALSSWYSTDMQISDSDFLIYLNIERNKLASTIKNDVKNDFFYEKFTTDIVANQNEYSFEKSLPSQEWIERILSVEIKQNDQWKRLIYWDNTNYDIPLDKLQVYDYWMYDIKDSSIFIYPTPTESVTDWLIAQVLTTLKDVTINSPEDDILWWHSELRWQHYILWIWVRKHVFQAKALYQEKDKAIEEYNYEIQKMVSSLRWRYASSLTLERNDLSYYKI